MATMLETTWLLALGCIGGFALGIVLDRLTQKYAKPKVEEKTNEGESSESTEKKE